MKKYPSLFMLSIVGAIISIIAFALFVVVVTGTVLIILDSFSEFWVPILISCSAVFLFLCVINIILYSMVILNKNYLIQNKENDFAFWISAFIFWVLSIFSWVIFIFIHFKEKKDLLKYISENGNVKRL